MNIDNHTIDDLWGACARRYGLEPFKVLQRTESTIMVELGTGVVGAAFEADGQLESALQRYSMKLVKAEPVGFNQRLVISKLEE